MQWTVCVNPCVLCAHGSLLDLKKTEKERLVLCLSNALFRSRVENENLSISYNL